MNWSGKCEGPGEGDRRGALCTRVHTSFLYCTYIMGNGLNIIFKGKKLMLWL